jgi:hypothetical protein
MWTKTNILSKCTFPTYAISSRGMYLSGWCKIGLMVRKDDLRLVPILVGQASEETGAKLAKVLEPYFKDPETYFIISSDFCHWSVLLFLA